MKIKKISRFKRFAEKYSFRLLKQEINQYGYNYSFKNFILSSLAAFGLIGAISYFLEIDLEYILLLGGGTLLMVPLIIRSQFVQLYQFKRFDMLVNYLDNVIPIFKSNPKILSALQEVSSLTDGEMSECLNKAIHMIETNTEKTDILSHAFMHIESHFPNSRLHAVHKMMLTVEKENNKTYHESVNNMWYDVQAWIIRVQSFQKELMKKKKDLIILSIVTMLMNCMFIFMYNSEPTFSGFTDNVVYQISTTFFVGTLIAVICIFQIKLNGKWLIDDALVDKGNRVAKAFQYIQENDRNFKADKKQIVIACLFVMCGIYLFTLSQQVLYLVLCVFSAYMLFTQKKRKYKNSISKVKKQLEIEFPIWLRDVALNLQNLTVLNSVQNTKKTSSDTMNFYIDKFLDECYENPTSILPYNHFLDEYNIQGVKSSMKVLFTLQTLNKEQMVEQTNNLIIRNQELLEKSERMRNEDSVSGLTMLGFVPVAVLTIQMLISMGLLFAYMMDLMSSSLSNI